MAEHFVYILGFTEPVKVSEAEERTVRKRLTSVESDVGYIALTDGAGSLLVPMRSIVALESRP
jgi:hypothetical protein